MRGLFNKLCLVTTVLFVASLYIGQTSHLFPAIDTTNNFTGVNTFPVINNVVQVDGTSIISLSSAFSRCTTTYALSACTIDMRGTSISSALSLGSFDPTTTPVTILLGPYNYTGAITLRSNLTVLGVKGITNITQINTSTPVFALPTSGTYPGIVASGMNIGDFNLVSVASSTSDAISFVAAPNGSCTPQPSCQATNPGGGVEYSSFHDIYIQPGFGRNGIRIDSTLAGPPTSAFQFGSFRDIFAFRKTNGPPVLYITGAYNGQLVFDTCQFDGQYGGQDTTANLENVYIDDTAGQGTQNYIPYSITFQNVTSQFANGNNGAAFRIEGPSNIFLNNDHFENDLGIVDAIIGPGGHGSFGIELFNPYIATSAMASHFSGVTANTGFVVHSDGNSAVHVTDGVFFGTPDNWQTGTDTYITFTGDMMNGSSGAEQPKPGVTVAHLPSAASAQGSFRIVTDSTSISSEGQNCTGLSSNYALAWSNGSNWKCF